MVMCAMKNENAFLSLLMHDPNRASASKVGGEGMRLSTGSRGVCCARVTWRCQNTRSMLLYPDGRILPQRFEVVDSLVVRQSGVFDIPAMGVYVPRSRTLQIGLHFNKMDAFSSIGAARPYPRLVILGDRPVKVIQRSDGRLDILVFDWNTGKLTAVTLSGLQVATAAMMSRIRTRALRSLRVRYKVPTPGQPRRGFTLVDGLSLLPPGLTICRRVAGPQS